MLRKLFNIIICAAMLSLTACGSAAVADDGRPSVVCTTFSCYDWTREMIGDHADDIQLIYLLSKGEDMHSFQPSAADMVNISKCDVFICVGGESETWAEDALKEAVNKDMRVIRLLDTMGSGAKVEEIKEGMADDGDDDEEELDEHVWLSLKNAELLCGEIANALGEIDPDNADDYKANREAYSEKLSELDGRFAEAVANAENKTLIFGDRFPFRYLFDDCGLDYYAAFAGCAAETEASFKTVAFLAKKVDEIGTDTVFTIENSDGRIAQAIIENTAGKDQKTAEMNSLQSVSMEDIGNGKTYLSMMEENYAVIKKALS